MTGRAPVALLLALGAVAAEAAPEEIQVYLDDMTAPGHVGLDVHNNFAADSSPLPAYPGARPDEHVYRLTPEFYYGLTPSLELGAYVLSAYDRGHAAHVDGAKLRVKYVAPHDESQGAFWGVNVELGRSDRAVAEQPWNYEVKGIWGDRIGRWLVAINLNADASLSPHGGPATLESDAKFAYGVSRDTQVGLEAYCELGTLRSPGGLSGRSEMLYAAVDSTFKRLDLNAGIGRGLTTGSDGWVFKAIVGFHF
ncbi:MAG: hypothetical protein JSR54_00785 [Proteobacteria bacterium]|nr:hypothetical protein [Pseudomonadota bacterium]